MCIRDRVRGNPVDDTALLSAWGMFVAVREADSERLLAPSAPGVPAQERLLRMPISREDYERAVNESENSAERTGVISACVVWDDSARRWVNDGIRQASGLAGLRRMCVAPRNATAPAAPACFFALECFTRLSHGVFGLIKAPMDCEGVPLGSSQWDSVSYTHLTLPTILRV